MLSPRTERLAPLRAALLLLLRSQLLVILGRPDPELVTKLSGLAARPVRDRQKAPSQRPAEKVVKRLALVDFASTLTAIRSYGHERD